MALTQKKQEELLDNMARRLGQKVREMIEPPTLAQRIYPHLKRSADDQPKRAPIPRLGTLEGETLIHNRKVKQMEMKRSDLRSDAQRIADRLKGSNDTSTANTISKHGDGPTRTITSVHHSGHQHQHGPANEGEGNIVGGKR